MNKEDLRKLLAGIGITALLSGTSIGPGTQQAGASGWGGNKPGAGSAKEAGKSGWSGTATSAGSTEQKAAEPEKDKETEAKKAKAKAGKSGWGAQMKGAGSTEAKEEKKEEKKPQ